MATMNRWDPTKYNISLPVHLALIFIVAILLRWVLLDAYHLETNTLRTGNPVSRASSAFFFGDSEGYFDHAQAIMKTGSFGIPYRPPLYPALLAVTLLVFPSTYLTAHLLQILLGALVPVLFALLARQWISVRAAIITGWLTAASFQHIILSATLCSEILFAVLVSGSLLLLDSRQISRRLMAGLLLGMSILTRPEGAVFALPVVIVQLFRSREPMWKRMAVPLAMTVTVMVWSVRNYIYMDTYFPKFTRFEKIVPVSSNGPINFYLGNGPMASGGYRTFSNAMNHDLPVDMADVEDPIHREAIFRGYQAGLDYLVLNPGRIPELLINKTRFFARGFRAGFGVRNSPWGLRGSLRRSDMWSTERPHPAWLILIGAIAGWSMAAKKRPRFVVLAAGFCLAAYVNALVFFGLARQAATALPFLFMGVSVVVARLIDRSRQGLFVSSARADRTGAKNSSIRGVLIGAFGWCLIVWLIVDAVLVDVTPRRLPSTNSMFIDIPDISDVHTDEKRTAALLEYKAALAAVDTAETIVIMEEGFSVFLAHYAALINGNNMTRMKELVQRALELDPSNSDAWKVRGLIAMNESKPAEARAAFRRYLQIDPWAPDIPEIKKMMNRNKALAR